jgi:hypothetical protein
MGRARPKIQETEGFLVNLEVGKEGVRDSSEYRWGVTYATA